MIGQKGLGESGWADLSQTSRLCDHNKKAGYLRRYPAFSDILRPVLLGFAYPEHFGPTYGAHTLSCSAAILHGYSLGVPHFPFCMTLNTVRLHWFTSFLSINDKACLSVMSIAPQSQFEGNRSLDCSIMLGIYLSLLACQ